MASRTVEKKKKKKGAASGRWGNQATEPSPLRILPSLLGRVVLIFRRLFPRRAGGACSDAATPDARHSTERARAQEGQKRKEVRGAHAPQPPRDPTRARRAAPSSSIGGAQGRADGTARKPAEAKRRADRGRRRGGKRRGGRKRERENKEQRRNGAGRWCQANRGGKGRRDRGPRARALGAQTLPRSRAVSPLSFSKSRRRPCPTLAPHSRSRSRPRSAP